MRSKLALSPLLEGMDMHKIITVIVRAWMKGEPFNIEATTGNPCSLQKSLCCCEWQFHCTNHKYISTMEELNPLAPLRYTNPHSKDMKQ